MGFLQITIKKGAAFHLVQNGLAGQRVFEGFGQALQTRADLRLVAQPAPFFLAIYQPHLVEVTNNLLQQAGIAQVQVLGKFLVGFAQIGMVVEEKHET
jgi:hypothetical protein